MSLLRTRHTCAARRKEQCGEQQSHGHAPAQIAAGPPGAFESMAKNSLPSCLRVHRRPSAPRRPPEQSAAQRTWRISAVDRLTSSMSVPVRISSSLTAAERSTLTPAATAVKDQG